MVRFRNGGTGSIDMTGWRVEDEGPKYSRLVHRGNATTSSHRPDFLIEFELGCAFERRALFDDGPTTDDRITRFQRDENQRKIHRFTAEFGLSRTDS
jgi:hypothetical protein